MKFPLDHFAEPGSSRNGTFCWARRYALPSRDLAVQRVGRWILAFIFVTGALSLAQDQSTPPQTQPTPAPQREAPRTQQKSEQEKSIERQEQSQRAAGVLPQFGVTSRQNASPLTSREKFHLFAKSAFDPVTIGVVGLQAGISQAENEFPAYGQGAQGYAKRYAANFSDGFIGTMIGSAILPSLLKQDPRYFYKGTGTVRSRALYAVAMSVVCKGDNGHWQPNYSSIIGSLAAGLSQGQSTCGSTGRGQRKDTHGRRSFFPASILAAPWMWVCVRTKMRFVCFSKTFLVFSTGTLRSS